MLDLLNSGPETAPCRLLLAPGAGAAMTSPFMNEVARLLCERAVATTRFEFAYMAARREGGKRRPPPRAETLVAEYEEALAAGSLAHPACALLIGGKSMGGRVASMIADSCFRDHRIAGLVCLGYPFHPPAKPGQLRTGHLEHLATPALFIQGERDPFGSRAEIAGYKLSPSISLHWAADGDHDLGPRGGSGFTRKGNLTAAADAIAAFMRISTPASR